MTNILEVHTYVKILFSAMEVVILYFLISDAFKIVPRNIYKITKSKLAFITAEILIIFMLINQFRITTLIILLYSYIVNKKENIRDTQIEALNRNIVHFI